MSPVASAQEAPAVVESATVLGGKLAVALLCAVMTLVLARHPRVLALSSRRFDLGVLILAAAMRLGLFVAVFIVLGMNVTGDVSGYYVPQGEWALEGRIVYRDFESSYSVLFPYLVGLILLTWHSAKAVVLAAIALELLSLPLWLAAARRWLPERTVRIAALLYVTSPIPFLNIALKGHNQVWVSILIAASLWALARRDILSGAVQGFSLMAVKVLSLLFAPVIWLFAPGRIRWAIAFSALPLAALALCAPNKVDLLFPLKFQAQHFSGGNLPYLSTIFGLDPTAAPLRHLYDGLTMLALAGVFLYAWARGVHRRPENVLHLLTLVLMTFFLASKKAYASYLVMCFFPLCITLAAGTVSWPALAVFGAFGALAALEPSLHFRWMFANDAKQYLSILFREQLPDGMVRWKALMFLAWDVALVSCYAAYFTLAWRRLFADKSAAAQES
jgi:hypothetical protein